MLSQHQRGLPFTLIEAMSCARATISTDVGGVREAVGDNGAVVPRRSWPSGLALELLRDRGAPPAMAEAARSGDRGSHLTPTASRTPPTSVEMVARAQDMASMRVNGKPSLMLESITTLPAALGVVGLSGPALEDHRVGDSQSGGECSHRFFRLLRASPAAGCPEQAAAGPRDVVTDEVERRG